VMTVNLRLSALGRFENKLPLVSAAREEERGVRGRRPVIFDKQPIDTPIYIRGGFRAGDRLDGPAVIEDVGATILVYPGDSMTVSDQGFLIIDVRP
jgi:N-methylhydantoinase A